MNFVDPKEIIEDLPLKDKMTVVDFGCGAGAWIISLADKIEEGIFYAVDILEEPLSILRGRAKHEGLKNIKTVKADVEKGVDIRDESADLVLMTNFLFQVEDKEKVFTEAKRILKNEGLLLVMDWLPESKIGPGSKVSPKEVEKIAQNIDFEKKEEFQAGMYHYGFIYKK